MQLPGFTELKKMALSHWPQHPSLLPRTEHEKVLIDIFCGLLDTNNAEIDRAIQDNSAVELVLGLQRAEGKANAFEEALTLLSTNMHAPSVGPCETCQRVTVYAGFDFGCVVKTKMKEALGI